jgi:hypothetical protein
LTLGSSVGSGQTVHYSAADELILDRADHFAGAITGFAAHDSIDLIGFGTGTTLSYAPNNPNTGGTLTVTDGSLIAHILFGGAYSQGNFKPVVSSSATLIEFA